MASEELENPRSAVSNDMKASTRRKSVPKSPGKSNKALIKNALIQVLAGPVYEKTKVEVLEVELKCVRRFTILGP